MHSPFGLSVKALIVDGEGRYLVIQRASESSFWPGQWDLPGGKIDPGETFDQALLRECQEETGLEVRLTHYVGGTEWELPHVCVVFLIMAGVIEGGQFRLSEEHEEHQWVSPAELRRLDLVDPIATIVQCHFGEDVS